MENNSATKATLLYGVFLAMALGFLMAGLIASNIGFVFSQRVWLDTAIYAAIITLNSLNVVLIIPRLLSLALCGRDVQMLKEF